MKSIRGFDIIVLPSAIRLSWPAGNLHYILHTFAIHSQLPYLVVSPLEVKCELRDVISTLVPPFWASLLIPETVVFRVETSPLFISPLYDCSPSP